MSDQGQLSLYRLIIGAFTWVLVSVSPSAAQFGSFEGDPSGSWVRSWDRPHFRLDKPFEYIDPNGMKWIVPSGEVTDGASIPGWAWSLVGGSFDGQYLYAAIVHDYFCCTKSREYYSTHHAFWLGMRAFNVEPYKAEIMWAAVRWLGPHYWIVDPTKKPPEPCHTAPSVAMKDTALDDDERKSLAKMTALARTLKTTGGRVLDFVGGTAIETQTPAADAHLDFLREARAKNFDVPQEQIGLVSNLELQELSQPNNDATAISAWLPGQIPELDAYMTAAKLQFPDPLLIDAKPYVPLASFGFRNFNMQDVPLVWQPLVPRQPLQ